MPTTEQLLDAVIRKAPEADPATALELIVSCNGDLNRVFELLGVKVANYRQTTFKVGKPPPRSAGVSSPRIHLFSPQDVEAAGVKCSLHLSVLEPSVARQLLHKLMEESHEWSTSKFYLFGRQAQSGHSSALYLREPESQQNHKSTYQGRQTTKKFEFSPEMHDACNAVEQLVHSVTNQPWHPDVAVCNRYDGASSSVDWHSDQLTHLGPEPIIACLSLGCEREFRLKDKFAKRGAQQWSLRLPHNSVVIMHSGCQEHFKHSIPATRTIDSHALSGATRISLTFRMYPAKFHADNLPKCRCNKSMLLRTTNDKRFKYIWQCGQAYVSNEGCDQTLEADFDDCSLIKRSAQQSHGPA